MVNKNNHDRQWEEHNENETPYRVFGEGINIDPPIEIDFDNIEITDEPEPESEK